MLDHRIIWCVSDGKKGHVSQLAGLTEAMQRKAKLTIRWVDCHQSITKRLRIQGEKPQLIICAGHKTHKTALLLKWLYGGKIVVLMKPSLPYSLFDLCVIPQHDNTPPGPRILTTQGAMNTLVASLTASAELGLILVGGPSRHHSWSDEAFINQVENLVEQLPNVQWTLTTSRRTPSTFVEKIQAQAEGNLQITPLEETGGQWLQEKYNECGVIWVSEDSVSMLYESLTVGASVGTLAVTRTQESRVSRGVDQLLASGAIIDLNKLQVLGNMPTNTHPLNEADRIASLILKRFDDNVDTSNESSSSFT